MAAKKLTAAQLSARGGHARARTMPIDERRAIASLGFAARRAKYNPAGESVPKATHLGVLEIGNAKLPCAVLSDGTRLLSHSGVGAALGRKRGGRDWAPVAQTPETGSSGRLPFFMGAASLKPFISAELEAVGKEPVLYSQQGGRAFGIRAEALPMVCDAWLRAREAGALRADQLHIAQQAEIVVRGLAHVGIAALIDECTGYQEDRSSTALSEICNAFIAKELRPWMKTFPDEYYRELYRLKNWPYDPETSRRNQVVGQLTNSIVYDRLAPGLRAELNAATPRDDEGRLMLRFHQQLSAEVGHPKLREHINMVLMLMRANVTWQGFKRQLDRSLPRFGHNYELGLGDGEAA